MPDTIKHTSWAEHESFLALPPASQNLMIYMASKETNGALAEVIRDIAEMKPIVKRHDFVFRVVAIAFGAIIAIGPFILWGLTTLEGR